MRNKPIIGIIGGRGMLGKIFKKFFRKHGYTVLISGRKTKLTGKELVKKSDVVIFSVPIDVTKKVIGKVLPYTRKEQLLMDLTSIKEEPIKVMLKSKASVIGLHPIFGSVASLKGKTIIIVPARPGKWLKWLLDLFKKEKINVKIATAKKHDQVMAILQGLIHFNFITIGHVLRDVSKNLKISLKDLLDYGGIIYRIRLGMIARILAQDPALYADISILNKHTKKIVRKYEKTVKGLSKIIRNKDKKAFIKYFKDAADFFGNFKKESSKESSFLIEQLAKSKIKDSKKN